jgi:hypothetical protein
LDAKAGWTLRGLGDAYKSGWFKSTTTAADLVTVVVRAPPAAPVTKPSSWAWKILNRSAHRRFVDLDKKTFFDLLAEVASA